MGHAASYSPAVVETHTSVLIFLGDLAFKVKKPVSLGFLELSTVAARKSALSCELALNRRLSPDVYLGLTDFVLPDGRREPVLCMRRLPDDRKLSNLIRQGACTESEIRTIARELVAFHRSCEPVPSRSDIGSAGHLESLWRDAFEVLERQAHLFPAGQLAAVRSLATAYLDGRSSLFETRRRSGKIRDGHGDLLADDIFLLPDGIRILDCLEFDPTLRCGDVLRDAAFLAMHIEYCGDMSLASAFVDEYRVASEDDVANSLVHHYIAYRAVVRAKVEALRIEQGHAAAAGSARTYLQLAEQHLKEGEVRLTVVSGLPASGKSTLSQALMTRSSRART